MRLFVELHSHSNFSLLDGAAHPEELIARAAGIGMPALAVTDHDGLYCASRFYTHALEAGIKPIIGAELTLKEGFHITLLVENREGYVNLCRLLTKAQLSESKGNACLPFSGLAGNMEGLICLSGCARGEIPTLLRAKKKEEALTASAKYLSLCGRKNFYIELQHHLNPEDTRLCKELTDLAGVLGLRTVASNNAHYAVREDFSLHDILTCIRHRVILDHSGSCRRANSEFYLKGYEEMSNLPALPRDALRQTLEIAERCTFELDFSSYSFPDYPLPEGETAADYLRKLALERAQKKYGEITKPVMERLNHELGLIEQKGLAGYFLIVWDIVEFARNMGISAQGRGSAASSLVAYLLAITPVDPLRHNLFVGRFLNEFAIPDIDIDIATRRREEVIRYVYEKYGVDHAAMVCTYITFQARNAVREVGKVLGLPPHILDRMAKSISSYGGGRAIETLMEIPEFRGYLDSRAWRHFCSLCTKIADFPRHLSIHVGGMIVSSRPIPEIVPLEHARAEGRVVCQWDKDSVDDAGLIKVDLLGLRMLSLIDEAVELVMKHQGVEINFDHIAMDDPEVYEMIANADTVGVFQVESRAQMQTLPKVRPRSIEDLTVEVAIIRPGPLQGNMVHPYIRRRQGLEPVAHLHPRLAPILDETLGVILFQEQILQVACEIAGFSAGEANNLRKTMGRKHAKAELQKWYTRFAVGAQARGVDEQTARKIFDHIGGFAEFGFCKSHAASFAILCYRSAFLKRYYPAEFYCALLNNQPMGFYIPEVIIGDAKRHNVNILPADVNKSLYHCSIEEGSIRIGFRHVKEIGEDKAGQILRSREQGPFLSLRDFSFRTGLDRESVQNLIAIGAFDTIRRSRRQLLWEAGLVSEAGFSWIVLESSEKIPLEEMNSHEETVADYTIQGFSAPHHLLNIYRKRLMELGAVTSSMLPRYRTGDQVKVGGYCVCLQVPGTAKGFAFLTLEDEEGLMNVVLKPKDYNRYSPLVRLEPLLFVEGILEKKEGIINIIARQLTNLRSAQGQRSRLPQIP
jgi:error-prone DNA polymerase